MLLRQSLIIVYQCDNVSKWNSKFNISIELTADIILYLIAHKLTKLGVVNT
jgi:hypothetical protein